jgi:hypothetical protein
VRARARGERNIKSGEAEPLKKSLKFSQLFHYFIISSWKLKKEKENK